MEFQKLLKTLTALDLPKEEYILVGSAPLAIRGIRKAEDLDIIISDKLWQELSRIYPVTSDGALDRIVLSEGIDVLGEGSMFQIQEIAGFDEMIQTADIVDSHRYLNLELLKKFKLKKDREKDLKDVELINQYLATQSK